MTVEEFFTLVFPILDNHGNYKNCRFRYFNKYNEPFQPYQRTHCLIYHVPIIFYIDETPYNFYRDDYKEELFELFDDFTSGYYKQFNIVLSELIREAKIEKFLQ